MGKLYTKTLVDKRANRSDKYQYIIVEILMSSDAWNTFTEAQEKNLPLSDEKKEILLDWDHDLQLELHKMIEKCLTPRQRDILKMYTSGMTQMEIAEELGINQSSVTKSLNGNTDYLHGKRTYGGMKKKFVKLIRANHAIRPTMKKIHLIWEPNSIRLPHYQTFRNLLGTEEQFEKWLEGDDNQFIRSLTKPTHQATTLTMEQILQIRQMRADGISINQVSRQFNISPTRVKKLARADV